jgi:crossover junction endodeoxyribonuclease RuvC
MRILGVDPGSRLTGYGILDIKGNRVSHVAHGTIRLNHGSSKTLPLDYRLFVLYENLIEIIEKYQPQVLSLEKIFFAKNVFSAFQLGQTRGVILLMGAKYSMDLAEYNPTEVKRAVVGQGRADKEQVQKMIQLLLGVKGFETADSSDALAIAMCHAQLYQTQKKTGNSELTQTRKKRGMSLAQSLGIDE